MAVEIRKAVLLAAGRGKRLGSLTLRTPKPLLEVAGAPLVQHIALALGDAAIDRFVIVAGYLAEQVEAWAAAFGKRHPEFDLSVVRQGELSGTAGAMLAAKAAVAGDRRFIFGWGDVLMDRANYRRFAARAAEDDYDLLLAVNRTKDPWRGAAVYLTGEMRVERLVEKPPRGTSTTPWNNAGLFSAGASLFDYLERLEPSPRGKLELPLAIPAMIADGLVVRAIDMRGFWSDVGTPADLELARRRFRPKSASR